MGKRRSASAVVCIIVLLAAAVSLHGQSANTTTFVTVSGPVALPGLTLGAGTYIFEVVDPYKYDIVTVLNKDRSKVYYSGFTRRVNRPTGQVGAVSIEEAPPGVAPRILEWYPIGLSTGHGFIYPKGRR
jgi:hypothetical protein